MRRTATVLLGTLALAGALAPTANAVPDPTMVLTCVTEAPSQVTGLVDPAAATAHPEVPLTTCLAP
jgi:hypothetical protein